VEQMLGVFGTSTDYIVQLKVGLLGPVVGDKPSAQRPISLPPSLLPTRPSSTTPRARMRSTWRPPTC
jgi:hypothetical protein